MTKQPMIKNILLNLMVFGNERRKEIQNVFVICIELSEIKDTDIEENLDTAVGYVSKGEKTPKPNAGASY